MSCASDVTLKPEWIKVGQATRIFGIGRTKLYELISNGTIKSSLIRPRGALQGTRLISYDSLSEYIESFVEQQ